MVPQITSKKVENRQGWEFDQSARGVGQKRDFLSGDAESGGGGTRFGYGFSRRTRWYVLLGVYRARFRVKRAFSEKGGQNFDKISHLNTK